MALDRGRGQVRADVGQGRGRFGQTRGSAARIRTTLAFGRDFFGRRRVFGRRPQQIRPFGPPNAVLAGPKEAKARIAPLLQGRSIETGLYQGRVGNRPSRRPRRQSRFRRDSERKRKRSEFDLEQFRRRLDGIEEGDFGR